MTANLPLAVMLYQKRSNRQVPPLYHSPILAFAQLDLIALNLTPCALDQSCFSRVRNANQSMSVAATKSSNFGPILFSGNLADVNWKSTEICFLHPHTELSGQRIIELFKDVPLFPSNRFIKPLERSLPDTIR